MFIYIHPTTSQNFRAFDVLFDGYQNLSVQNIYLTAAANVNGLIEYADSFTGNFTATLKKVAGWRMINLINNSSCYLEVEMLQKTLFAADYTDIREFE